MKRTILILSLLSAAGCGELGNDDYQGEPEATVHGELRGDFGGNQVTNPHIGIIWIRMDMDEGDAVVGQVAPVAVSEFPVQFDFDLFEPPPREMATPLTNDAGDPAGAIATGIIVALDDVDGDGQFMMQSGALDGGDLLFGAAWVHMLMYVFEPPTAEANLGFAEPFILNADAATQGFHVGQNVCIREDNGERVPVEDVDALDEEEVWVQPHYEIADDSLVRVYLVDPVDHFPKEGEQPGCDIM